MTHSEINDALFEACLYAANELGEQVKGMSCFLENWTVTGTLQRPKLCSTLLKSQTPTEVGA